MKKTIFPILVLSTLMLIGNSCKKEKASSPIVVEADVCDSIPASFATDVMPIFQNNCVGCHNDANNTANGQNWETYAEISASTANILKAMKHESGVVAMPDQLPKLSDSLIQVVECWIDNGALDN